MRPDTRDWRDDSHYEYFDRLPVEGLAWECLRRYVPYQEHYSDLVNAAAQAAPLPQDAQQLWGLRFRGKAGIVRPGSKHTLVAVERFRCPPVDAPPRLSAACLRCTCRTVCRRA